jgi:6-phosphogluconate dehydrogenase (decarboxylating)
LAAGALKEDPRLEQLKGYVQDSGESRWIIADAIEKDVPVPTLATALFTRFRIAAKRVLCGKDAGRVAECLRRPCGPPVTPAPYATE